MKVGASLKIVVFACLQREVVAAAIMPAIEPPQCNSARVVSIQVPVNNIGGVHNVCQWSHCAT